MYARLIAEKLLNHKLTIATAESVTGGLLSSSLTDIAGASRFFKGAIVAYSNELKKSLLNVKQSTLINHGAVSRYCVREMALGLMQKFNVDIAVACSGLAGPDALENQAVGSLFFCVIVANKAYDFETKLPAGSRNELRQLFVQKILQTVEHILSEIS
ncbi:CinA family protein [Mycoplasmoides pneumoniae]|uniref:Competence/damage-inducible protein CinA C-terminal domain protein n=3 Tax=Mycoplasmoides pneumoniae TaxID=2104 RepID=A0A0H3DKL5_MYCPB|nr:CinA family protein [Mycoplasmoides pneumoniae]ADK86948.1 competence/damage-inducible protein CinA C-terminal domain protein [Mycoplasmoides pneumoniae FH]ALA31089.1 hypothetical protein B434_02915 [Mycoplasmoides pneumoniae 19294]ALA31533.1 hypothetical protein F536_01395 [Mycoplasmoides pneumoniae 39443]ALA36473.1 hypothetical protein F538_01405 [Mycoplasmoides pneumoniae M1139]ALA37181.1 hypothetical protein RF41_01385 [Mycoplasmoides pneumoniae]